VPVAKSGNEVIWAANVPALVTVANTDVPVAKSGSEVIATEEPTPRSGSDVMAIVVPETVNGTVDRLLIVTAEPMPSAGSDVMAIVVPDIVSGVVPRLLTVTAEPMPNAGSEVIAIVVPETGSGTVFVTLVAVLSAPNSTLTYWCWEPPTSSVATVTPVPLVIVILSAIACSYDIVTRSVVPSLVLYENWYVVVPPVVVDVTAYVKAMSNPIGIPLVLAWPPGPDELFNTHACCAYGEAGSESNCCIANGDSMCIVTVQSFPSTVHHWSRLPL